MPATGEMGGQKKHAGIEILRHAEDLEKGDGNDADRNAMSFPSESASATDSRSTTNAFPLLPYRSPNEHHVLRVRNLYGSLLIWISCRFAM